ncbi:L,D-transpeptidase [Dokdonia ponticola]|uniref:L,D-transpeptidase n=1 Tax=Dokdonia ponticola TaxID=2041041 RepID=A0ABV9HWQ4_9FLAO
MTDSTMPILVKKDVRVKGYFKFIDSLVIRYDTLTSYSLTEHLLVRANPWIIDTLQNTDYYRMKAKDSLVYDQKEMIILKAGSMLEVPAFAKAEKLISSLEKTYIDINIPEYTLRIYEDSLLQHQFTVRVGRNEKKYLKMAGRVMDLRTITGNGLIVGHVKNPDYYNPANGHQYFSTRRDDNEITKLPQIPFLETEVNGVRNGQLIHPTTNPISLGKAYSNGCIGTREADAWVIYYHAPIGTKLTIRYTTTITNAFGETKQLDDIYGYEKTKK